MLVDLFLKYLLIHLLTIWTGFTPTAEPEPKPTILVGLNTDFSLTEYDGNGCLKS